MGGRRPADIKPAVQVHLDDRIKLVSAHLVEEPIPQDAGVVDHRIDAAKHIERGLHHAIGAGVVRHAVAVGAGLAAQRLDLFDHALRRAGVTALTGQRRPQVIDHYFGALGGALQRDVAADAAAGTGDQHHLAIEHAAAG